MIYVIVALPLVYLGDLFLGTDAIELGITCMVAAGMMLGLGLFDLFADGVGEPLRCVFKATLTKLASLWARLSALV